MVSLAVMFDDNDGEDVSWDSDSEERRSEEFEDESEGERRKPEDGVGRDSEREVVLVGQKKSKIPLFDSRYSWTFLVIAVGQLLLHPNLKSAWLKLLLLSFSIIRDDEDVVEDVVMKNLEAISSKSAEEEKDEEEGISSILLFSIWTTELESKEEGEGKETKEKFSA